MHRPTGGKIGQRLHPAACFKPDFTLPPARRGARRFERQWHRAGGHDRGGLRHVGENVRDRFVAATIGERPGSGASHRTASLALTLLLAAMSASSKRGAEALTGGEA